MVLLFSLLIVSFEEQKFFILMKYNLYFSKDHAFGTASKKSLPNQDPKHFSSRSFKALEITFCYMTHFFLNFHLVKSKTLIFWKKIFFPSK